MYKFNTPLIKGIMIKRKSQFTALININGEEITAHIPTTNRIGDVENKNIPCLVSYNPDPKRKLQYTIEAVLLSDDDNWVGINQILSNRVVEHFIKDGSLSEIIPFNNNLQREVKLGNSKLDFKVGDTYIEVKTPLTTINVKYAENIKVIPQAPFSSTDRVVKHLNELSLSLEDHERALFIQVLQYKVTEAKQRLRSTNYEQVSETVENAKNKGVEFYTIQCEFTPEGVKFYKIEKSDV